MSGTGFSYAQAARGQPTAPGATAASPSTAASQTSAQEKGGETLKSAISSLIVDSSSPSTDSAKLNGTSPSSKPASDLPASPATSSTLIGTTAESSSNFSFDEGASSLANADKPARAAATDARSPPSDDVPRKGGRKSKAASKNADKDTATTTNGDAPKEAEADVPKIELAPAPVPAVNIWSQRMIQHAAKAKPQTAATTKSASATASRPAASAAPANGTKGKDGKKSASGADTTDTNGTSGKAANRRANDTTRPGAEQTRRNAPRGARGADKDDKLATGNRDSLPSVHDATSWPTPESSAVTDDTKTKAATDKPDAADKDAADESSSKNRKKGWVQIPFVPTVNFQTPIPTARSAKPKPSARAPRDPASRNGTSNAAAADKSASAAASPVDNKQSSDARETTKDAAGSATQASRQSNAQNAAPSKRAAAEQANGHPRETRKPLPASLPEKPKEALAGQHQGQAPKAAHTANGEFNGQSHQASHHSHGERRGPYAPKGGEHKDGHPHSSRLDQRGERPGRGGFRGGRGGGPQNQHMGHSYQPNGRVGSGASHSSSSNLPPTAAPFNPPSHQLPPSQHFYGNSPGAPRHNGRASGRPQTTPQPPVSYGGRPQHRMYMPHSANMVPAEYQAQPFSFPSFNPYMDNELLHGLVLQVDYYFSVDNLCKDFFLRKQMNDQGFVPLATIAQFKRMSELAPSLDFIRAACEQSENLDYVVDQEQNEWIRSRQHWSTFVLVADERNEDARKPGPDMRTSYFRSAHSRPHQPYGHSMMAGGYPPMQQAMYNPNAYPVNGQDMHYNGGHNGHADFVPQASSNGEPNGRSHKGADSQLSASVPDFSPGGAVRGGGAPMTLEDYQTNPDEQVEKMVVAPKADSESR